MIEPKNQGAHEKFRHAVDDYFTKVGLGNYLQTSSRVGIQHREES